MYMRTHTYTHAHVHYIHTQACVHTHMSHFSVHPQPASPHLPLSPPSLVLPRPIPDATPSSKPSLHCPLCTALHVAQAGLVLPSDTSFRKAEFRSPRAAWSMPSLSRMSSRYFWKELSLCVYCHYEWPGLTGCRLSQPPRSADYSDTCVRTS